MESLNLSQALLVSLLGVLVVFFVLLIIMWFIQLLGKVVGGAAKKAEKPAPAPAPAAAPVAAPVQTAAPAGPVMLDGRVQLNTVSDRTAVMLMAIVADEMGLPLDELQFISIKEIGPAEGV